MITSIFKSLGFQKISYPLFDEVYDFDPIDAFNFSSITGANYLINNAGVSVKGRNETFIHRSVFQNNSLIYTPGLYERDIDLNITEGNSANLLKSKYPEIFKNNKKIILYKLNSNELSNIEENIFNKLIKNNIDPSNFILFKFRENYKNIEPFLEWISFMIFSKEGYIFENQTPFFQQSYKYNNQILNGGIPDISAFHYSGCEVLYKYNFINDKEGLNLSILPVYYNFKDLFNFKINKPKSYKYKLILGEAKSDSSSYQQALNQLEKYSKVELAEELYFVLPNLDRSEKYGYITINNNKVKFKKSDKFSTNKTITSIDDKWIDLVVKLNLLNNFPFDFILDQIKNSLSINEVRSFDLMEYTKNLKLEEIILSLNKFHGIH